MVNLELLAVMFAIGYIAYVFVAESVNPFRRFDLRRNHKRNHKNKLKRQQFLHRCGLLAGGVFVVSPLILALQPVEGGLPSQIRLCLITAGVMLLMLLLFQSLVYFVRWAARGEGPVNSNDGRVLVTDSGDMDMLYEDDEDYDDDTVALSTESYGKNTYTTDDGYDKSKYYETDHSSEPLDNILIDADEPADTDSSHALSRADQDLRRSQQINLPTRRDDDIYASESAESRLERQAMDNTISRIRSVFKPEVSIPEGLVLEHDLTTTANDPEYMDIRSRPRLTQPQLPGSVLPADNTANSQDGDVPPRGAGSSIEDSVDRISDLLSHDQKDTRRAGSNAPHDMLSHDDTETLIEQQRLEISRADEVRATIEQQLATMQAEVKEQKMQLDRSRKTARNATLLARSAALKQQQAHEMARQEKIVREKIEQKAQKAVSIAKNAITALALEEQKNSKTTDASATGK